MVSMCTAGRLPTAIGLLTLLTLTFHVPFCPTVQEPLWATVHDPLCCDWMAPVTGTGFAAVLTTVTFEDPTAACSSDATLSSAAGSSLAVVGDVWQPANTNRVATTRLYIVKPPSNFWLRSSGVAEAPLKVEAQTAAQNHHAEKKQRSRLIFVAATARSEHAAIALRPCATA